MVAMSVQAFYFTLLFLRFFYSTNKISYKSRHVLSFVFFLVHFRLAHITSYSLPFLLYWRKFFSLHKTEKSKYKSAEWVRNKKYAAVEESIFSEGWNKKYLLFDSRIFLLLLVSLSIEINSLYHRCTQIWFIKICSFHSPIFQHQLSLYTCRLLNFLHTNSQ